MRTRVAVVAAVGAAALLAAPAAPAATERAAALARAGIAHALKQHWIKPEDARRYRAAVFVASVDELRLPKLRARILAAQLAQVTALWDSYTSPRALALFAQLEMNTSYLEHHRVYTSSAQLDVSDHDGVVYRWFPGLGLEFHPLASFGALNDVATAQDADAARTLANALVARAIPRGPRLVWEYSFPFGEGRPPWASGMAQAVAAQALARTGTLLGDPRYAAAAVRAYAAVPPLVRWTPWGPWIRLYGFSGGMVLNAQLQAVLSLSEFGEATGTSSATALARRLDAAAQALLPRFDTGDWSLYDLGGSYAPLDYEQYVTQELSQLAQRTQEPFWADEAQRFKAYLGPPQITEGAPPPTLYPQPQDGFLDSASIPITLSQRSSVILSIGSKVLTYRLGRGAHVLSYTPPPTLAPGTYPVTVSAVSHSGVRATVQLAPLSIAWDTQPPSFPQEPALSGGMLTWQADDPGTPTLHLVVTFTDPAGAAPPQVVDLGQVPVSGTAGVVVPAGIWSATLAATNSAGRTATVDLGQVSG
jgi:hypothetical protein